MYYSTIELKQLYRRLGAKKSNVKTNVFQMCVASP